MKLSFNYYKQLDDVELYLCNPDRRELFPINAYNRNFSLRFNDLSQLEFNVPCKITLSDGTIIEKAEYYDYVETTRLIYATKIGWFRITNVAENDSGAEKFKTVQTESLQCVFKNKGFVSEDRVYKLYDPADPYDTLYDSDNLESIPSVVGQLHKQLGVNLLDEENFTLTDPEVPYEDWTITYISPELYGAELTYRNFTEATTYGYDWMVNDVENAFNVVVLFDFLNLTIQIKTVDEATQKSNLCLSFQNFMKNIEVTEDANDIVTVLSCKGENVDISYINPTGTNYIVDFSYYMDTNGRWMSQALIDALNEWIGLISEDSEAIYAEGQNAYNYYKKEVNEVQKLYQQQAELEEKLNEEELRVIDLENLYNELTVASKDFDSSGVKLKTQALGKLQGVFVAETVKIGDRSLFSESPYRQNPFTLESKVRAFKTAPSLIKSSEEWNGVYSYSDTSGTELKSISELTFDKYNLKYYFIEENVGEPQSYCVLTSKAVVSIETDENGDKKPVTKYECEGFTRYASCSSCDPVYESEEVTNSETGQVTTVEKLTSLNIRLLVHDWLNMHRALYNNLKEYASSDECNISESDWHGYISDYITSDDAAHVAGGLTPAINAHNANLEAVTSKYNLIAYIGSKGADLLKELNCYWIESEYNNENVVAYDNTTSAELIDLAKILKDAGELELSKICQPRYSFSLTADNILKSNEFKDQIEELVLGRVIMVEKEDGIWYTPALLEMSFNLDEGEDMSMVFANKLRLDDWGYTYADMIASASSTSRQVSSNWHNITDYSANKEKIVDLIANPLDSTLRAGMSNNVNQDFVIDRTGILGRKFTESSTTEFENEQLRISNNLLMFTDDGWRTIKTALGKIYYTDDHGDQVTSYGLIADTIIGELMMTERLKIRNSSNTVDIDANGITIKNGSINLGQIGTNDYNFSVSDEGVVNIKNGSIQLGQRPEGNYNFFLSSNGTVEIRSGSISIGVRDPFSRDFNFSVTDTGMVTIKDGAIQLGWDENFQNYNFFVDKNGIKLGLIENNDYNFSVSEDGLVNIKSGSINLGAIGNGDYNFSVSNGGIVNIKSGSINLGYNNNNGTYNFSVSDDGSVAIKTGSINLGNGNFEVTDGGEVTIKKGDIEIGDVNSKKLKLSGGRLDFYQNGELQAVIGGARANENTDIKGTVFALVKGSKWLGFGYQNDDDTFPQGASARMAYIINNGRNLDGYTEKNLFFASARFACPVVLPSPDLGVVRVGDYTGFTGDIEADDATLTFKNGILTMVT